MVHSKPARTNFPCVTPIAEFVIVCLVFLGRFGLNIPDESGSNVFRYALRKEGLHEMLQAIIWETLQWRGSRITAESGKEIGGEIHKSRRSKERGGRMGRSNKEAKLAVIRLKFINNSANKNDWRE